jgi:aspartate/methionine/tyrosine aminotransferase
MKEINGIASQTRLPLIVDEVFYPFLLKENINRAQSFTGNSDVLTFTLGGISKLSGLPQMKLSWIVVSGPIREVEEACSRLEIISDTYLSVSTPIQYALSGYLHNEILFESILRRVRENFARLPGLVTGSPLSVLTCEGGWNTILQFPARATDEDWCERLLNSKGIYMHPGHFYGMEGAYLVCSLLGPPKPFTDAIRSVADFVRE